MGLTRLGRHVIPSRTSPAAQPSRPHLFNQKLSVPSDTFTLMIDERVSALDADATLTAVEANEAAIRAAEADRLLLAAHWADLHGCLSRASGRALPGSERLIRLGGIGTPEVAEFAPAELGVSLGLSAGAAGALIADALDLRHRLPRLWSRVRAGEVGPWAARVVARAVHGASLEAAAAADRRVAPFAHAKSAGQLEGIALAAVIAADPEQAEQRRQAAENALGVWVGRGNDSGVRDIFIRTTARDAIWFDAAIDRVADGLGALGDTSTKDVRRGRAVGVLADPQAALDLFDEAAAGSGERCDVEPKSADRRRAVDSRPDATLYVHVSADTVAGDSHVARVEGVGPIVAEQVREWLGGCHVTVKPVLDLAGLAPVDAYEVPDRMREAVFLRSPTDVFPFATGDARRSDLDHTIAYTPTDRGGPPGQTRTANLGPHRRFSHRVKTHAGWRVRQLAEGVFLWRTPHGRHFLVDQVGTTRIDRMDSTSAA
jgi:hypothetical protein